MTDTDLPELPEPELYAAKVGDFRSQRAFTEAQVRAIQREAFKAGMLRAAEIVKEWDLGTSGPYHTGCMQSYAAIIAATKGE